MYTPTHFQGDQSDAINLINEAGLATLIAHCNGALYINHIPLLFDAENQRLIGHLARNNPDCAAIANADSLCAVFTGPHGYISPNYYLSEQVPTWNYSVLHVHGKARINDDTARLRDIIVNMTAHHEAHFPMPWTLDKLPNAKIDAMLRAIIAIEIDIERIDIKHKLSQNRSEDDQVAAITQLSNSRDTRQQQLGHWMHTFRATAKSE